MNRPYINGAAKWIVVALAVGGLIFNSGVLYNHVRHLTEEISELKTDSACLDEKIDMMLLKQQRIYDRQQQLFDKLIDE